MADANTTPTDLAALLGRLDALYAKTIQPAASRYDGSAFERWKEWTREIHSAYPRLRAALAGTVKNLPCDT